MRMPGRIAAAAAVVALVLIPEAAVAMPDDFGAWSGATRVESATGTDSAFNGPNLDGCPFISRDGKSFYMASNRPGGLGGIDIWVSTRASTSDPWGAPVNVGAPVNSAANDFCPTISRDGHEFFFVSNRPGWCGSAQNDDIYAATRASTSDPWSTPVNLGPSVNSDASETRPSLSWDGTTLYFGSDRSGGEGSSDHYVTTRPRVNGSSG